VVDPPEVRGGGKVGRATEAAHGVGADGCSSPVASAVGQPVDDSDGPRTLADLRRYVREDYREAGRASFANPSVVVTTLFRVSQLLWRRRLRPLAKLIEWFLVMTVSSQLAPSAKVGPGLCLPHTVGIVLGGNTRIGHRVTLGQNVTLGSNYGRAKEARRQPYLCNGVRVAAGAVLAGPIKVGTNVVIGANAVVTIDVPADHVVRAARSQVVLAQGTAVAKGRSMADHE
jgi:serine O-acetyltransferase